jgi:uncharacterized protein (TIGR03435 family)
VAEFEKNVVVLKLRAARERKRARGERVEGVKPYELWPCVLVCLAGAVVQFSAQTSTPTFEVASVKPGPGDNGRTGVGLRGLQGNLWLAENVPLLSLIRTAYSDQYPLPEQIVDAPTWAHSARFTVNAKAERLPSESEARLMLQHLLADRFGLAVHNEKRDLPVFALMVARDDGKLGSELRPVNLDCDARRQAWNRGELQRPAANPGGRSPDCSPTGSLLTGTAVIVTSGGLTMGQFATELSRHAGRPVIDRTGLQGFFNVTLKFQRSRAPSVLSDTPPLAVALRTDLQLKLESVSEAFDVLVIDSVRLPIEN